MIASFPFPEPGAALAAVDTAARWILSGWGGSTGEAASFGFSRWLFLRALGVIYLTAFVSLWVQVDGLVGPRGILPAADYLKAVSRRSGGPDPLRVPTLFWLGSGRRALHLTCGAGCVLSLLLVAGVVPALCLLVLWGLYLSFAAVGRVFLSYQWDVLLLEAGFLGVLLAPWPLGGEVGAAGPRIAGGLLPDIPAGAPGPALLLLWWLVFRLTFQSGVGKLTSGDPSWRDLSALRYHWWTQPLPAWTAWHVHRLPLPAHRLATAVTLAIEVAFPLLLFGPREGRLAAVSVIVLLQVAIMATGNYNFFNLLTIALALLLVDDTAWGWLGVSAAGRGAGAAGPLGAGSSVRTAATLALAVPVIVVGSAHVARTFRPRLSLPAWLGRWIRRLQPFRTVNSYGLFRVMTTERPEIVVQGSRDGERWLDYEFRWKPGDPSRRPRFCAPHQPRLDWQMWFAALGDLRSSPWFGSFLRRLLEGAPPVRELLERDPFAGDSPRFVRAVRYRYRFTDVGERRRSGAWWAREREGLYAPPVARR